MLAIEHFERLMAVRMGDQGETPEVPATGECQLVKHRRFRGVFAVRGVGECSGSVRGVFGESGSVRGGPRPDSGQ